MAELLKMLGRHGRVLGCHEGPLDRHADFLCLARRGSAVPGPLIKTSIEAKSSTVLTALQR
jgi:hypothetical protein